MSTESDRGDPNWEAFAGRIGPGRKGVQTLSVVHGALQWSQQGC